jgi:hypothetical protein
MMTATTKTMTMTMTKSLSMILARFFILAIMLCGIFARDVAGFISQVPSSSSYSSTSSSSSITSSRLSMAVISFDQLVSRVNCYEVTVPKPLGVVFGENPDPFYGLVVDDVSEGMNGGRAGLRKGDNLLAVNEQPVVGKEFDAIMGLLQDEPKSLNLVFFRGPVSSLYTILNNQLDEGETFFDDDDDYDDEDSKPVIMDENYETSVYVEIKEQKPLTPGDFVKAFGKLASNLSETLKSDPAEDTTNVAAASTQPKKKTGFFGIGGESVQLDGQDAQGYKREKIEPDE